MRTILLATLGVGLTLAATGCNPLSAASEGLKIVRGAQAEATPLQGVTQATLAPYKTVKLGNVTTDVPPLCTAEVLAKVRTESAKVLADEGTKEVFPGGGKTLKLDVICRIYRKQSLLGGESRLDWWVNLVDDGSGQNLGALFVEGVSESRLEHGISDMAEKNIKEVLEYLEDLREGKAKRE